MFRAIILVSLVFTLSSCKTITKGLVEGMGSISKGILSLDENNFSNFNVGSNPRIKKIVYTPMKINAETGELEPISLGIKKVGFERKAYLMPLREETFEYNDRGKLIKQIIKLPNFDLKNNKPYSNSAPKEIFLRDDLVKTFSYDESAQLVTVNKQSEGKIDTYIYKYNNGLPVQLHRVINGNQQLVEEYDYSATKQLRAIKNNASLIELEHGGRGRAEVTKIDLATNQKTALSLSPMNVKTIGATLNYAGGTQNYSKVSANGQENITLKYSAINREHLAPIFNLDESPSGKFAFRNQDGKTVYFLQKTDNESTLYDAYTAEFFYEKAAGNAKDFNPPKTDDELLGLIKVF